MRFISSTRFRRHYRKLPTHLQDRTDERLELLLRDPFNPLLNNHPLHGVRRTDRSINVTGDYRVVYRETESSAYLLIDIGTHDDLYGK